MAWCPFATKVEVSLRDSQKKTIKPAGLVLHTAVSNSQMLRPSGDVRWHFYCNEDGELFQFFDTTRPAACQRDGNYWTEDGVGWGFISVETWDGAGRVWDGQDVSDCPPWTAKQVESLAKLYAWLHETHGVPLVKATGVHGRGLGVHNDFTAKSGLRWNTTHACPTSKRKAQRPTILARSVAIVKANSIPKPPPPKEEEDIVATLDDLRKVVREEVLDREYAEYIDNDGNGTRDKRTVADILYITQADVKRLAQAVALLASGNPSLARDLADKIARGE